MSLSLIGKAHSPLISRRATSTLASIVFEE